MSTPTLVVLVATVPVTVFVVLLLGRAAIRRVLAASREATRSYERLAAYLDRLEQDGAVTRRELARVEEGLEQLRHEREARRSRVRVGGSPEGPPR